MAQDAFEELAKRYDTEDRIELANIIGRQIKKELQGHSYSSLLDYGSGTGLIGLELAGQFDSVLLADASKQMMEVADVKISNRALDTVETLHLDLTKNYTDLNADVIILSLVLLHVPDTEKLLGALYKILNTDGRLIIVDFDKNHKISHPEVHNGFTHEEIKDNLLKAGFKSPAVETFHHGTGIFMKEDASLFLAGCTK